MRTNTISQEFSNANIIEVVGGLTDTSCSYFPPFFLFYNKATWLVQQLQEVYPKVIPLIGKESFTYRYFMQPRRRSCTRWGVEQLWLHLPLLLLVGQILQYGRSNTSK